MGELHGLSVPLRSASPFLGPGEFFGQTAPGFRLVPAVAQASRLQSDLTPLRAARSAGAVSPPARDNNPANRTSAGRRARTSTAARSNPPSRPRRDSSSARA